MSAERLRAMLSEATPGPWTPHMAAVEASDGVMLAHAITGADNNFARTDADARLIALAPDAIALLADAADALTQCRNWTGSTNHCSQRSEISREDWCDRCSVLARLDALCGDER